MKRNVLLLTLILTLMCVVSCKDSSDESSIDVNIVGEWEELPINGNTSEIFHYNFKDNQTGLFWVTGGGKIYPQSLSDFKWSTHKDVLKIVYEDGEKISFSYTLTNNTLTTSYTLQGGETEVLTYKRVK